MVSERKRMTLPGLFAKVAEGTPITWLTCYDYPTAYLQEENRILREQLGGRREILGSNPPPAQPSSKESLADRASRLIGIDISRCPLCGGGPMRVLKNLAPVTLDPSLCRSRHRRHSDARH